MPTTCGPVFSQGPLPASGYQKRAGASRRSPAFPSALTAHRTFVRVNFGVISVWARRRPRCGKEDLHALCRDVIRSRRCTGCIVPLRGVRMEGSGLSLGKSRGRSRSDLGSSRVRGLRRGRFHRDSFPLPGCSFPAPFRPASAGHIFRLPHCIEADAEGSAVAAVCRASLMPRTPPSAQAAGGGCLSPCGCAPFDESIS